MLKQTVTYTDYNDEKQTEDLYFNLTKTEMMDLLDLLPRMEAFTASTAGQERDMTPAEIKEMLAIIKQLIEKAYGVRSADGKHFRKSEEIFNDFAQSAVYDAFVFNLFEDLNNANNFMVGIMPKDLLAQVQKETGAQGVETIQTGAALNGTKEEVPAYIREDREPTRAELAAMSPSELQAAFRRKSAK